MQEEVCTLVLWPHGFLNKLQNLRDTRPDYVSMDAFMYGYASIILQTKDSSEHSSKFCGTSTCMGGNRHAYSFTKSSENEKLGTSTGRINMKCWCSLYLLRMKNKPSALEWLSSTQAWNHLQKLSLRWHHMLTRMIDPSVVTCSTMMTKGATLKSLQRVARNCMHAVFVRLAASTISTVH